MKSSVIVLGFIFVALLSGAAHASTITVNITDNVTGNVQWAWGEWFNGDNSTYHGYTESTASLGGDISGNEMYFKWFQQWNLSSLPENISIIQAREFIYIESGTPTGGNRWLAAYEMLNDTWNEQSIDFTFSGYNQTLLDNVTNTSLTVRYSWNVTQAVKNAVDADKPNVSILYRGHEDITTGGEEGRAIAASRRYANSSLRPYLEITYITDQPVISSAGPLSTPRALHNITFEADLSSTQPTPVIAVNLTLKNPAGHEEVNDTNMSVNGDVWNLSYVINETYGEWTWQIVAYNSGGFNTSSSGKFNVTLGDLLFIPPDKAFSQTAGATETWQIEILTTGNSNSSLALSLSGTNSSQFDISPAVFNVSYEGSNMTFSINSSAGLVLVQREMEKSTF